jgi:hypothetical protein
MREIEIVRLSPGCICFQVSQMNTQQGFWHSGKMKNAKVSTKSQKFS